MVLTDSMDVNVLPLTEKVESRIAFDWHLANFKATSSNDKPFKVRRNSSSHLSETLPRIILPLIPDNADSKLLTKDVCNNLALPVMSRQPVVESFSEFQQVCHNRCQWDWISVVENVKNSHVPAVIRATESDITLFQI